MIFNAIFASAKPSKGTDLGAFGLGDGLPWPSSPEDMKHFKGSTMGGVLVMGYKTYKSIGELPDRRTIVISKEPIEGVETYKDILLLPYSDEVHWVIGGKSLLTNEVLDMCEFIYHTEFADLDLKADVYLNARKLLKPYKFFWKKELNPMATLTAYIGGSNYEDI